MDTMGIIDNIGQKYGLTPEQLEGGTFTKGQSTILIGLFRTAIDSQKDEDWEAYLETKAKYLTGK